MEDKKFFSTAELALLLGISRVEAFRKIQKGQIPAKKAGRNFLIAKKDVAHLLSRELTNKEKKKIDMAVDKVIEEYGETLKLLGKE
ncbi:MAG TPA: hypothetical protein DCY48_05050 [Candidatus Magasanikbacteria bacterium]|nr:MAG: hypothetical protein A3I74_05040 [Candidatus Magasanikbacteria bacterium RIFCSPLOWO2_02_FULL_47_16]OGH79776.1 MAG: hypothetical protein A3C10_04190 [Candidatus Magasanikbacteria bacterium RIFCSPHIGHO2_02_FULL_48_18]OGH82563.1 MAG: hypothetical protein A3G08_03875 [Candidatus Magasanikbacteria bacterium RIFCSPLOWO2_12_FULL_47_9b]HAZ29107.1 hypothetical protein [Candidatus Magasanikbacteria bacterium]